VTTQPGWYPDPTDDALLRYWDGQAWGSTKSRSSLVNAGNKIQKAGDGIAKFGTSLIWITIGIALLFVLLLLL
jgi:hypothetical protein